VDNVLKHKYCSDVCTGLWKGKCR